MVSQCSTSAPFNLLPFLRRDRGFPENLLLRAPLNYHSRVSPSSMETLGLIAIPSQMLPIVSDE